MKIVPFLALACASSFAGTALAATGADASAPTADTTTETTTCRQVSQAEITALFDRWNDSLATLDPDQVVANYAPDAVLLPTVSDTPRTNHQEIRAYFVDFLNKTPQGTIDRRIVKIGCNLAQDVGVYTFTLKGDQKVQARYTYVYEYRDGQWLIAHHHSSAMPEK